MREPRARLTAPYLLGANFTVGDLSLAATLREPGEEGVSGIAAIDLAPFPNVAGWLDRCSARPANPPRGGASGLTTMIGRKA